MQTKSDKTDFVSVGEASTRLGYSVRHIHRLRKAGMFPDAKRIGENGHWRFSVKDIEAVSSDSDKAVAS